MEQCRVYFFLKGETLHKNQKNQTRGLWINPFDRNMSKDDTLADGRIASPKLSFCYPIDDFNDLLTNPNIMFANDAYTLFNKI